MREYSEYVGCPCCGETMRLARSASHAELPSMETFECKPCGLAVTADAVSGTHALLPPMETFECKPCGLAVTAEAVNGSHALIEKHYFS